MDEKYMKTKEKIDEGLAKLNTQPITAENACQYKELSEALLNIITASVMLEETEYGYSGDRVHAPMNVPGIPRNYPRVSYDGMMPMSRDGRMGMDGDNDGRYNESGNMPRRYYYSGHTGKEHMMMDLKAMMADADSEKERRRIKDLIEDLQELK